MDKETEEPGTQVVDIESLLGPDLGPLLQRTLGLFMGIENVPFMSVVDVQLMLEERASAGEKVEVDGNDLLQLFMVLQKLDVVSD